MPILVKLNSLFGLKMSQPIGHGLADSSQRRAMAILVNIDTFGQWGVSSGTTTFVYPGHVGIQFSSEQTVFLLDFEYGRHPIGPALSSKTWSAVSDLAKRLTALAVVNPEKENEVQVFVVQAALLPMLESVVTLFKAIESAPHGCVPEDAQTLFPDVVRVDSGRIRISLVFRDSE